MILALKEIIIIQTSHVRWLFKSAVFIRKKKQTKNVMWRLSTVFGWKQRKCSNKTMRMSRKKRPREESENMRDIYSEQKNWTLSIRFVRCINSLQVSVASQNAKCGKNTKKFFNFFCLLLLLLLLSALSKHVRVHFIAAVIALVCERQNDHKKPLNREQNATGALEIRFTCRTKCERIKYLLLCLERDRILKENDPTKAMERARAKQRRRNRR